MNEQQIKLLVLRMLDELISTAESPTYADDDPSGVMTTWTIDSEKLRSNILSEIGKIIDEACST